MTWPRITDVLLHADEQQELQERYTETEWASHEESFSICSPFFLLHCFLFLSNAHSPFAPQSRKSRARRGGHTATFLSMLCWLGRTLPLRGWWGGMALWRNQPSASIAVIIIWIPDCWICSFGPLRGWEMTCLCSPDTLSVCSETAHPASTTTPPCSTLSARVEECFFNDWRGPSIKPATPFVIHGCACSRAHFLKEGGYEDTKNSQWKNKTKNTSCPVKLTTADEFFVQSPCQTSLPNHGKYGLPWTFSIANTN